MVAGNMDWCHLPRRLTQHPDAVNPSLKELLPTARLRPDCQPTCLRAISLHAYRSPQPDSSQQTARDDDAQCTPDFFLYDADRKLAYRGRLDGSTPGNGHPVTGVEMRAALEAVLRGAAPSKDQRPAIGCSIKWR